MSLEIIKEAGWPAVTHEGPLPTEISTQGIELAINWRARMEERLERRWQRVWESNSEALSSPLAPAAPVHVSRKDKFRLSKVPA